MGSIVAGSAVVSSTVGDKTDTFVGRSYTAEDTSSDNEADIEGIGCRAPRDLSSSWNALDTTSCHCFASGNIPLLQDS